MASADVGQKSGEEAEQEQIGAELKNKRDAGVVGEMTEGGGADAAHAKRKTEEETGDEADAVGEKFLRVNENGGERGSEDDADDDGERGAPKKIRIGEEQCERRGTQNGDPNDGLPADAVTDGTADDRAGGDGGEDQEEEQLGVLDRDLKGLDKIERVIAAEAGQVEIFRENQHGENREGGDNALRRQW